jgi:hypothetical protein
MIKMIYKITLTLFVFLLCSFGLLAQYEAVVFDYSNAYFNNGQPLKAESYLLFSGAIAREVSRVEINIFKAKSSKKYPLYTNTWKNMYGSGEGAFSITCNYKLRGNSDYDFVFNYFRPITADEKEKLRATIEQSLDSYLHESFTTRGKKVKSFISNKFIIRDMNKIVWQTLTHYRNDSEIMFVGFSDMVGRALKNLSGRRLRDNEAGNLSSKAGNKNENKAEAKANLYESRLGDVRKLVVQEIAQVLDMKLLIKVDTRTVEDYPTTSTPNILAVNVGYGAVYLDEKGINDINYVKSPYAGLSFAMGNSAFSSRFWTNSSLSVGAFVNNFTDAQNNELTGPIFGRPYYVGYGYRLFRFIRLNAGAVFLEDKTTPSNNDLLNSFQIRPFVGVSMEINLWLGLGDKKR